MSTEPSPEAQEISRSIIGWSASVDSETAERMRANARSAVERKIDEVFAPLRTKNAELEAEVERLRKELGDLGPVWGAKMEKRAEAAEAKVRELEEHFKRVRILFRRGDEHAKRGRVDLQQECHFQARVALNRYDIAREESPK